MTRAQPEPDRLMLDEMFAPRIAELLHSRGVDCRAVAAEPELRAMDDPDVLEAALADDRVLVTENVADFELLRRSRVAEERPAPPLIYTSSRAFPRNRRFTNRIVEALERAAVDRRAMSHGGVYWLDPSDPGSRPTSAA